jgi:hypothetical protein
MIVAQGGLGQIETAGASPCGRVGVATMIAAEDSKINARPIGRALGQPSGYRGIHPSGLEPETFGSVGHSSKPARMFNYRWKSATFGVTPKSLDVSKTSIFSVIFQRLARHQ